MAVSRLHYPATSDVTYATRPLYITLEESDDPLPDNYRAILELYHSTDTAIAKLKVVPNANGVAIFRVDKVCQSVLQAQTFNSNDTDLSIHEVGTESSAKYFSRGGGGGGAICRTIKYKIGYESSTSPELEPTETINATVYTFQMIGGSGEFGDAPYSKGATYGETQLSGKFINIITDTRDSWLLSDSYAQGTKTNQWDEEMMFMGYQFRGHSWGVMGFYADGVTKTLQSSHGAWATTDGQDAYTDRVIHSISGNGGVAPGSVSADTSRVQYAITGYNNILEAGLSLTNLTTAKYLDFCLTSSGTSNPFTSGIYRTSTIYRWELLDCSKFDNYVCLGWQNSFGCWDYATFIQRTEEGLSSVNKKTIVTPHIDYTAISSSVAPNYLADAGRKRTVSYEATRQCTVHTLPQTGERAPFYESLVASPQVYRIFDDGTSTPVTLSDTNFSRRLAVNELKPVQYSFTFTYDRPMLQIKR